MQFRSEVEQSHKKKKVMISKSMIKEAEKLGIPLSKYVKMVMKEGDSNYEVLTLKNNK